MINDHQSFAAARAYIDPTSALVERFVPMVRRLAWHMHGMAGPDIEPEDLIQAGLVALTECAQRHNRPDGEGFAAYAKIRVKGAMIDQLRRSAPLSRGAIARRRAIREAESRLRGQLGREPSSGELAEAMELSIPELDDMRASSEPMHFESISEAYSDSNVAFQDQSMDSFARLVSDQNREVLIGAIARLPQRLQLVIQLYFVEDFNLLEISKIIGVSVPRVHQLKDQALQRIKVDLVELGIEACG